ncbi:uncharacterized protein (DUF2252 family) [Mucilaginibacter frigoritolerans]|jgi:uncharacterized protein (DUF2252 family)|uniref:Uncharacterized protein (DUF2252 family) n=1 Tax=Mucilaginibacter frigoritolerans TaxID=652788 RepID=A0A562U630_9SPHI|nr:DUF2252 family protein [Mucilaginibacter frigoritolerans]TWJ00847.1 uncharacterized protein (DUF2252 family) [Mucilaginibacter frigoritolerans]
MSQLAERLKTFNAPLLPEMVQLKYEAMTENAFRFYRGTCHLFYEDLANANPLPLSPLTWICGDLHIENYGSYKGDNKLLYFDMNDFDEGILAPACYEVARMATSIFIAFDALEIEPEKAEKMVQLFLKTYSTTLAKGKAISIEPRTAKGIVCNFLNSADKATEKELLKKRTISKKKKIMLSLQDERHFKVDKKLKHELTAHVNEWIANSSDGPYNYEVKGVVFRLAGTGSLGLKRYLFLLKSTNTKNKYLLVDMKQSTMSSVAPYVKVKQLQWQTEAERIITIQKRMQNVSSSLLSTTVFRDESYVIQELQPVKDTIKFKLLKDEYRDIYQVIDDMASLLASAQLRSGGIQGSSNIDDLSAFGTSAEWQQEVLGYALKYAKKVKKDYEQFVKDYKNGVFEIKKKE